jgi:taurine dioxygenase
MKKPEFMAHHAWTAHEIAVWDNRSTQHYAMADYWPHDRVNQRVTFDEPGTVPVAASVNLTANDKVLKGKKLIG